MPTRLFKPSDKKFHHAERGGFSYQTFLNRKMRIITLSSQRLVMILPDHCRQSYFSMSHCGCINTSTKRLPPTLSSIRIYRLDFLFKKKDLNLQRLTISTHISPFNWIVNPSQSIKTDQCGVSTNSTILKFCSHAWSRTRPLRLFTCYYDIKVPSGYLLFHWPILQ